VMNEVKKEIPPFEVSEKEESEVGHDLLYQLDHTKSWVKERDLCPLDVVVIQPLATEDLANVEKARHDFPSFEIKAERICGLLSRLVNNEGENATRVDPDATSNDKKSSRTDLVCAYCKKKWRDKHCLENHLRVHTGIRPFACNICGKSFKQNIDLKVHKKIHTDRKRHHCLHCNKSFFEPKILARHVKTHAERPKEPSGFFCKVCNKKLPSRGKLEAHSTVHSRDKPFCCKLCGKYYSQKVALDRHLMVHSGVKAFHCTKCDKSFFHKHNLKSHMVSHTGESPFTCNICGKTFTRKFSLEDHQLIHTRELFPCTQCSRTFVSISVMQKHVQAHRKGKLQQCQICKKSYFLDVIQRGHRCTVKNSDKQQHANTLLMTQRRQSGVRTCFTRLNYAKLHSTGERVKT